MKIYNATTRSNTDLSRYVGKDVWVHVSYCFYGAYWVRILEEQPHFWVVKHISDMSLFYPTML